MLYLVCAIFFQAALSLIFDHPDSIVADWTEQGRTDPNQPIKLTFALKNQNVDQLHDLLMQVSTPGNDEYGNHRDYAEMYNLLKPTSSAINNIKQFLTSRYMYELIIETPNEDLISIETTVGEAEILLNTEYWDYKSDINPAVTVSRVKLGDDYSLDSSIGSHLYFVSPTHRFPFFNEPLPGQLGAGQQNPTKLRALYNVGSAKGSSKNNSDAIASFRDQYYQISDCQAMWKAYDITPCNVTNVPSDEPSGAHLEAELDTQYMSSMGEGIPMQVWWTKGINFEDALLEWTQNVIKAGSAAPPLFSVSYGGPESAFGGSYIEKLNTQLMMMGTAGVTVMFASGDSGAGGGCTGNQAFAPDYPASSPYVTAVGGVTGGTAGKTPVGESAWVDGGGGFSNYAAQQSWQKDAVTYYLANEKDLPASNKYNASGRGFPDIAAQSTDFVIYVNGRTEAVSGTSCASPTAGGIMALLNDLRAQNGQSKLGFANPFIYQTAAANANAFNDCTEGYNKGCGVSHGFEAFEKWDPASGWGSPNYAALSKLTLETGLSTIKHNQ